MVGRYAIVLASLWTFTSSAAVGHASGTWIAKAPMPTARKEIANATVALNGQIYVLGGVRASDGARTGVVERYDPATDTWQNLAPLPFDVWRASAAAANGKIYIFGGNRTFSFPFNTTNRVFEYDPGLNTWLERAPMPTNRGTHSAVNVDGLIHVVGGANSSALATHEIYDPVLNSWTTGAAVPTGRSGLTADLVDGHITVAGGYFLNPGVVTLNAFQAFNVTSQLWDTSRTPLPVPRLGIDAAVANGRLYVFGGAASGVVPSRSLEYDPTGDSWTQLTDMPNPVSFMGVAAVRDTIYVIGGGPVNLNRFDGINANWAFVPPSPATAVPLGARTMGDADLLTSIRPNPFSTTTTIRYGLPEPSRVFVTVYDVLGRPVRTLVRDLKSAGVHAVDWNGEDDTGRRVATGVYFYRIEAASASVAGKVQVLR